MNASVLIFNDEGNKNICICRSGLFGDSTPTKTLRAFHFIYKNEKQNHQTNSSEYHFMSEFRSFSCPCVLDLLH